MTNQQKMTCLIIEDEPIAAEVLEDYIKEISFLELKGVCKDAIFALEVLRKEPIDVIFLDIHLPKLKGLDFLKSLPERPQTILTTAYHQYAVEAFAEEVVDYLMKPISFSRFIKAVNKLKPQTTNLAVISNNSQRPFRLFNVNKKQIKLYFDEVLYIESLKDYSRIHRLDDAIVTRGQIGEMEAIFKPHGFLRIHRSYMVALDKINAFSSTEVEVGDQSFPIGRSYKELVTQALNDFFIN